MKNGVIIAAKATYDCGKTTAIRGVWLGLKKCGAQEITEPKFYSQGTGQPQDVEAVIEYKGVKIGISSRGDPGINQAAILDDFIKAECRIIICACRMKGDTKAPIDALKDSWDIRYIHTAAYGYISVDTMWNELMQTIRIIKFVETNK